MAKLISKNIVLESFMGIFLGFFLPACDCAVVTVSKMFIKKKASLNVTISFMLASPIINRAVLLLTLISLIFITNICSMSIFGRYIMKKHFLGILGLFIFK